MSGLDLLLQAAGCSDDSCSSSIGSAASLGDSIGGATSGGNSSEQHKHLLYSNFLSASRESLRRPKPKTIISRSCSNSSLPPKKRIRLAFGFDSVGSGCGFNDASFRLRSDTSLSTLGASVSSYAEPPTLNSEWTAADVRPRENNLLQLCNRGSLIAVPNSKSKKQAFGPLKRPSTKQQLSSATGKKRKKSHVRDLDGNDMCMGYFSTMTTASHKFSSSPADEEQVKPKAPNSAENEATTGLPSPESTVVKVAASVTAPAANNGVNLKRNSTCSDAKSNLYEAYLRALNNASMKQ